MTARIAFTSLCMAFDQRAFRTTSAFVIVFDFPPSFTTILEAASFCTIFLRLFSPLAFPLGLPDWPGFHCVAFGGRP